MKLIKKEIQSLYLNNLLRGIAFALFGIFIPIYLLIVGFTLKVVLFYFLIFKISTFLSFIFGHYFSRKFGYKTTIICSAFLLALFVLLFQYSNNTNFLVYLIAIILGAQDAFYFLPFHAFFTQLSEENKKGTQFSNYLVFGQLAGLIGPLIGAFIATFIGFQSLFLIVLIFTIISIVPLLYLKNIYPKDKISISKILKLSKEHKGFFFGTILDNIKGEIGGAIWAIVVFFSLKDLISLGWVGFLLSGGTIFFTLFLGRHYDLKSKYLFLRMGGIILSVLWILRYYYINSSIFIFISSFIAGFLSLMIEVPFTAIFYDKAAKEISRDTFIVFREFPAFIGYMIVWGLAILFVKRLELTFIIAAIVSLVFVFLKFGVGESKIKK